MGDGDLAGRGARCGGEKGRVDAYGEWRGGKWGGWE